MRGVCCMNLQKKVFAKKMGGVHFRLQRLSVKIFNRQASRVCRACQMYG